MPRLPSYLRDVWQRLRVRPDALMLELGPVGELLVPQHGSGLSSLPRRADVRLRQAKQTGRNRVLARVA